MRLKVALAATVAILLLLAVSAYAHVMPMGIAKGEIRRATAQLCAETSGCVNWHVGPCRRRSAHRVDCVSGFEGENGTRCAFVTIAHVSSRSYTVIIHHKRVFCN